MSGSNVETIDKVLRNSFRCKRCLFGVLTSDAGTGTKVRVCYRYPKTIQLLPAVNPLTRKPELRAVDTRPAVADDDWCGEFTEIGGGS